MTIVATKTSTIQTALTNGAAFGSTEKDQDKVNAAVAAATKSLAALLAALPKDAAGAYEPKALSAFRVEWQAGYTKARKSKPEATRQAWSRYKTKAETGRKNLVPDSQRPKVAPRVTKLPDGNAKGINTPSTMGQTGAVSPALIAAAMTPDKPSDVQLLHFAQAMLADLATIKPHLDILRDAEAMAFKRICANAAMIEAGIRRGQN